MSVELSIRFSVPPSMREALVRHTMLATLRERRSRVDRTYFDFADLRLSRNGIALHASRLKRGWRWVEERRVGELGWIVRMQNDQCILPVGIPDPARHARFGEDEPLALRPSLTLRGEYRGWTIRMHGVIVEAGLLRAVLEGNGRHSALEELELRVRGEHALALVGVADRIQSACRLHLAPVSIAGRGAAMYRHDPPPVTRGAPYILPPDIASGAAFSAIVRQCVDLYLRNEAGIRAGEDPESVHQARVALRQISSACSAFSRIVPKRVTLPIRRDIRWLARTLGEVRDWEVLRTETLAGTPAVTLSRTRREALDQALLSRIAAARARMHRALRSARYARLQMSLSRWIAVDAWQDAMDSAERLTLSSPARQYADALLARRHRQLIRKGSGLASASPERRHALRIAAKKLRYSIEFFGSLYRTDDVRRYVRALRRCQDALGMLNDNRVARERLGQMAAVPMTGSHPPIRSARLERHLVLRERHLAKKLLACWERFLRAGLPRAY